MIPTYGMKEPTENKDIYFEVCKLIQEAKRSKEVKTWRGTTIEPLGSGYVKLSHGEKEYCHWHNEMLATMLLTLIHGINIC